MAKSWGVERDDYLPHQIRLFWDKPNQHSAPMVAVGCCCRVSRGGKPEVFGYVDGGSPWKLFNRAELHSKHSKVPFDESFQGGPPQDRVKAVPKHQAG